MRGFVDFIRNQGVLGLAVGFILGASVAKVVDSLVNDILNPVLGVVLGTTGNLKDATLQFGSVKIMWGSFVGTTIDFVIVALAAYIIVRMVGLDPSKYKK